MIIAAKPKAMNTGKGSNRFRLCTAFAILVAFHFAILGILDNSRKPPEVQQAADTNETEMPRAMVTRLKAPEEVESTRMYNISNTTRLKYMTESSEGMLYVPAARMMLMTMAKAGTSTTLMVVYQAAAGRLWNSTECGEIHDKTSACWQGHAMRVSSLSERQQWSVLTSNDTLRIAIQREPYQRLISAYKSIYSCDVERFRTHVPSRNLIVPGMRKRLHLAEERTCMNVSEFGHMLDVARENVGKPTYPREFRFLDNHIRPQEFFFDEIDYQYVFDVSDLSDASKLDIITSRLPYKVRMGNQFVSRFSSGDEALVISDEDARSINAFARISKQGALKYGR